jgi:hypothetical protein
MKSIIIVTIKIIIRRIIIMEEKAYKTMGSAGGANLIIGICLIVGAASSGILLVVHGARLLRNRKRILL